MAKQKMLDYLQKSLMAILAGLSISIGCIAFLSSGNKIVGSLFFVIGLFMVCNFNLNLFTGKVCFSLENKPSYIIDLIIIWVGNFAGACLCSALTRLTRLSAMLESCQTIVNTKLNDSLISLFILGIFCNILIFLAVYGYKKFDNILAKMLALIFGVSVFVLAGFEHCVADMFYFTFAGAWTAQMLLRLIIITAGNIVGGLLFPCIFAVVKKINKN